MLAALVVTLSAVGSAAEVPHCAPLGVPVAALVEPPSQYTEFCAREPGACTLSGAPVLSWSEVLQAQLATVNGAVNAEIRFTPDLGNSGREESWDYPDRGFGDCEDFALEKRRRLIEAGLPSAAFTCAIVMHDAELFFHTVLLAETSAGTLVLDDLRDEVLCWDAVPYVYRLRERPDGLWTRFALP